MENADNRIRKRILLVLFIGVLMGALDIAIVGPALPAIRTSFGVDDRAVAWIFTIYVLFNLIGTPLMAKLSDVLGRRSIYVLDVALFGVGSSIVALSPTFAVLLTGRAVQGLGAGGIFPVASAVIGDTFPPEKRGSALGLIGAVFGIAFLIGPVLAGMILYFLSWHWLFLVNLPIALVVIALSQRVLPTVRPTERQPFDWPGMAVLGVMLAALTYGVNQIDASHFLTSLLSSEVWPFLVLAILLFPLFVRLEQWAADPVLRMGLFRSRQVILVSALASGAGVSEAVIVFVPALLVAAFGVTTSTASFMLLPAVLAMAVGSPLFGRLLDRSGSKVVVLVGMSLLTLGLMVVSFFATKLVAFYAAAVLVGLGQVSLLGATLRYIMLNEAPLTDRAAAQGALTIFISVGQLVGGALVGAIAASRGGGVPGYETAFLVVGVISLLLLISALRLKGRAEELATVRRHEMAHASEVSTSGQLTPVVSEAPTSREVSRG